MFNSKKIKKLIIMIPVLCVGFQIDGAAEVELKITQEAMPAGEINPMEQRIQEIIAFYKADGDSCRPGIIADGKGGFKENIVPNKMDFVCMLNGKKNVLFDNKESLEETFSDLDAIMRYKNIKFVTLYDNWIDQYFYTPAGETNAFLLYKAKRLHSSNEYITGHLLGYSDADINAFYQSLPSILAKDFEKDKEFSLKWIAENTPGIKAWVEEDIKNTPEDKKRVAEERMAANKLAYEKMLEQLANPTE